MKFLKIPIINLTEKGSDKINKIISELTSNEEYEDEQEDDSESKYYDPRFWEDIGAPMPDHYKVNDNLSEDYTITKIDLDEDDTEIKLYRVRKKLIQEWFEFIDKKGNIQSKIRIDLEWFTTTLTVDELDELLGVV